MGSFQGRLTKKILQRAGMWSEGTIEEQRARQELSTRLLRVPKAVRNEHCEISGIHAEWFIPVTVTPARGTMLYLHGGAYTMGSVAIHRELISRIVLASGYRVLAIDYRLAPEHPFPAALEDACSAWDFLLESGIDLSTSCIAGDSAGGGLAAACLLSLRDKGTPLPASAVFMSPWFDLGMTGESVQTRSEFDPMLDAEKLREYAGMYTAGRSVDDPLVSPLFADLHGLPDMLLQVGTDEILLDDSVRFAERAEAAGNTVKIEVYEHQIHVFQIFLYLPEARTAVDSIGKFLNPKGE
ncbi:alpha/beta hydrolase [Spirochaeta dissipatitropha]